MWAEAEWRVLLYHNDHSGHAAEAYKQNGAVVWSASYTAFGQATVEVNTITNNLRFPGQYYDAERGCIIIIFDIMPRIGRYLRRDPIGFKEELTSFRMQNNFLHIKDPLGLVGLCCKYPRETGGTTKEQCIQNYRIYQGLLPWKASSALTAIGGLELILYEGPISYGGGCRNWAGLAILIPDIIYILLMSKTLQCRSMHLTE